jgi:hypothetical protein
MAGSCEVLSEIQERPASTQKTATVSILRGVVGGLKVSTINTKNINGEPLGSDVGDPGATTIHAKKYQRWTH